MLPRGQGYRRSTELQGPPIEGPQRLDAIGVHERGQGPDPRNRRRNVVVEPHEFLYFDGTPADTSHGIWRMLQTCMDRAGLAVLAEMMQAAF
jgi:hypothetical protein